MIISFGGYPGSGKSSIAERLAKELGCEYYDIGKLRRKLAADRGLSIQEYNKLGETDPSTDREPDEYQADLGRENQNFVIVGRTSWHFIPHSLKIFLHVRLEVGAERIFKDLLSRNEGNDLGSVEEVLAGLQARIDSDTYRYQKLYGIDVYDLDNYDWVFDTSDINEEEAYQTVWGYVQTTLRQEKQKD